jgi:anti-sigma regulatory factor (Ser/Thr protein kinase)
MMDGGDGESGLELKVGPWRRRWRARRLFADFLAEHELDQQRQQDALLVVDELVAKAIEHASTDEDQVEITLSLEPESLLIRVLDSARAASRPAPLEPDESRESGRGMLIVNELCRWDEHLTGGRREVTAELSRGSDTADRTRPRTTR